MISNLKIEWVPEDKRLLQRKGLKFFSFILYIVAFIIFLLLNSFTAHLLDVIVNPDLATRFKFN